MFLNWSKQELNLKIVYYGPCLSGKTTNLEAIYKRVEPASRSELVSLKTSGDRTLFFDFLQLELGRIHGFTPKISLYTVPGQTFYEASRRLVLNGADGVVFVADSSEERIEDNLNSWKDMLKHLKENGLSLASIPLVIQFNKQDLPTALPLSVMRELLPIDGYAFYPAVAVEGVGVFETLQHITKSVLLSVYQRLFPRAEESNVAQGSV